MSIFSGAFIQLHVFTPGSCPVQLQSLTVHHRAAPVERRRVNCSAEGFITLFGVFFFSFSFSLHLVMSRLLHVSDKNI